jgi:hypothetical protein
VSRRRNDDEGRQYIHAKKRMSPGHELLPKTSGPTLGEVPLHGSFVLDAYGKCLLGNIRINNERC